ncbi:NUDIX hydrolase [Microbacterium sp.]|uniref:NUDIX hydrolase n=1 Tax=Microbacterium sp. TaxID=51671 RepID=UPI000929CC1C|nr:NUDIX hydrolase [Microbacterium sp.]MBN9183107.1 NUDIX hydrolase [Microbacterium sp.]MBN9190507.1 NUDIX hydrolase [Microbacterium sp.]MBN9192285.1 NUDIX hydrolase [Microbacterium sp.]OJU63264.1 MAG: DNA mismatch repair protein MutT [Microbacterium sp. 70-38]
MDMRVAAYAVIVDDDQRILLSHWIEGRRPAWTMPGGGLEPGEDPERAVKREVREETGYRAQVGELLGIHSRVIPPGRRIPDGATEPLHTLRIVYRATIVGGRLRNEIDGSTDRADWFPLATVRSLQRVRLVDIALRLAKVSY